MSRCSWILLWVFPVLLLACTRENVDLPPIAKTVPSEINKHRAQPDRSLSVA